MSLVRSIFNLLRFNKKNWKAVVLCLCAATVFWFFNALNKSYSTNISFPVTFEYDEARYVPMHSLPANVRMNVSGSGWDLFRRSLGFKVPPLTIPLEKPSEVKKIVGSTLPAIFAGQLERLKINFVITDTVRIYIDERIKRKFTVVLDSVQQYIHPGYGLVTNPVLTPDTVWLEGPAQVIDDLPRVLTLSLPQKDIRKSVEEDVPLDLGQKNQLTRNPNVIHVSFGVEKFVQLDKRVPLHIINIPAKLKQGGVLREITCSIRLPETLARTFTADSLVAIVNLKNKQAGHYKIVPAIQGLPQYAMLVKTDTVIVNF